MPRAASDLVAALYAARERWVDLDEGKAVRVRRPAEAEWSRVRRSGPEAFVACVTDWRGFTEADVDPEGGNDKVPFDAELWAVLALDRSDWLGKVIEAVADDIKARTEAAEARRKN